MENERQYYAQWGQNQLGPLSLGRLLQGFDAGEIPPSALARAAHQSDWQPIATLVTSLRPTTRSFYVSVGSQVSGPVSLDKLSRDLNAGLLPPDAFARPVEDPNWQRITSLIEELSNELPWQTGAPSTPTPIPSPGSERDGVDEPMGYRDGPQQQVEQAPAASKPHRDLNEPITIALGPAKSQLIDVRGADGAAGADGRRGRAGRDGQRLRDAYDRHGKRIAVYAPGGDGEDGTPGKPGRDGQDGLSAKLWLGFQDDAVRIVGPGLNRVIFENVVIDASGGAGGNGGDGGSGGSGGSGDPRGHSGRTAYGGRGGDGGDGGHIEITTQDAHLLSLVTGIQFNGGPGGRGGSGSPRGSNGNPGQDGSGSLSAQLPGLNVVERGSAFGLTPHDTTIVDDGSRLGGNFTRRSKFRLTHLHLQNSGDFSIFAPYSIAIWAEAPIDIDLETVQVTDVAVRARSSADVPCAINGTVRAIADIGQYRLRIAAFSRRGNLTLPLNKNREDGIVTLSVNHRLIPSEISVSSTEAFAQVEALAAHWNAQPPQHQASYFTAAIVTAMAHDAELSRERRAQLSNMLAGTLISPEALWAQVNTPQATGEAPLAAAVHFFGAMPDDSRYKMMDAAYFITTANRVVEQQEKDFLHWLARNLGFDEAWLSEHMPKVLEAGSSKIQATATNRLAMLGFPFMAIGFFFIFERAINYWSLGPSSIDPSSTGFWMVGTTFSLLLSQFLYRQFCYRTACRSCKSLNLKPVTQQAQRGSLVSAADAFRCFDCGARGNRIMASPSELIASDCSIASSQGFPLRVPIVIGAVLIGGILLLQGLPTPEGPDLHRGWVILLFIMSAMWGALTHSFRRVSLLFTLVAGALFTVCAIWRAHQVPAAITWQPARAAFSTTATATAVAPTSKGPLELKPSTSASASAPAASSPIPIPIASSSAPIAAGMTATIGNTGGRPIQIYKAPFSALTGRVLSEGAAVTLTGKSSGKGATQWVELQSPQSGWVQAKNVMR